jgi:D-arabinose 1-dehydrogenase-like Zn-dependent alcohol dehydrogenase
VVREFKKPLIIDEVPVPEVGPGQILVKIEASGCATPTCMRQTAIGP